MQNHVRQNETKSFRRAYFRVIVKQSPIERTISGFTSNERSYSCFFDQVNGNREFHPFVERNSSLIKKMY